MTQRQASTETDDMLNAYMRDVSRHALLTPEQERELGRRLIERRVHYWRAVLSYAPYAAAAVDLLARGEDPELEARLDEVGEAARGVRDSNRKRAAARFEQAVERAARKLAVVDPECVGADRIAADLELLETGVTQGVSMDVRPPRKGSQPFAQYLADVRRTSAALRVVRNRFAQANLRLVVRIAHRFQRTGLTLHDRVQEGNIGLMKAVDRFDPARGFRFSTYASWWIKHAIRRAVVNRGRTVRLPAHLQAAAHKLASVRAQLRSSGEPEPTLEMLAQAAEMPLEKVEMVLEAIGQRSLSLDAQVAEGDERSVADTLADEEALSPDELLASSWDARRVRGRLLRLSPMEQDILRQRFGLDGADERTLTEIGGQYSLSRERIRQLQQKALRRLKSSLEPAPALQSA